MRCETGARASGVIRMILSLALVLACSTIPANAHAHKDHEPRKPVSAPVQQPGHPNAIGHESAMASRAGVTMAEPASREAPKTFFQRLIDWLGRLHPMIVHFPLAFIPAALFTAVVGLRRPGFAKPVQFLVVTGGLTAPVAALSGWLDGGFALATDDWMLQSHRWIGTGIGVGALLLAIWALRRPEQDRSPAMIAGLSALTAAILVQGWFGGALIHGLDHLDW